MRERLMQRLAALKTEFSDGQRLLQEAEARQAQLRDTLLRISGAIQVLEETIEPRADEPDAQNVVTSFAGVREARS